MKIDKPRTLLTIAQTEVSPVSFFLAFSLKVTWQHKGAEDFVDNLLSMSMLE